MPRVLITGCSTGVGRALAVELSERGHQVIATARRAETLHALPVHMRLPLDVTDTRSVEALHARTGDVDVLVNNAGIALWGPIEAVDLDDVREVQETNVLGPLRMIQAFVPAMRQRGSGCVVNVTSLAAHISSPMTGVYAATKHALDAFTHALRHEVEAFGVRVVAVEPGGVRSAFASNRRTTPAVPSDYARAAARQRAAVDARLEHAMTSKEAAAEIADVIEDPTTGSRVAIGDEARSRLARGV